MALTQMQQRLIDGGRAHLGDEIRELSVGGQIYNALKRASVERVSGLRAILQEHGSLQRLDGIGPRREAEIRQALAFYDAWQLPLDDPTVRHNAMLVAVRAVGRQLVDVARLADDAELVDEIRRFVAHVLVPLDDGRKLDRRAGNEVSEFRRAMQKVPS